MMSCKKNTQRVNIKGSKDEKGDTQIQRTVYMKNSVMREDESYRPVMAGAEVSVVKKHTLSTQLSRWKGSLLEQEA